MDHYGTIIGADDYLTKRGFVLEWTALDEADKTVALITASDYIDATYGDQFSGYKTGRRDQLRQWPRTAAYDTWDNALPSDSVPREVEWATYQLALRAVTTPGILTADFNASEVIKKAAVEGAVSVEFGGSGSLSDSRAQFPVVDGILAPLLSATASGLSSLSGRTTRV